MNHSLISVRYAKALFKLVKEQGLHSDVNNDLKFVGSNIEQNAELKSFLTNPLYKASQKKNIVLTLFGSKVSDVTLKFLNLVVDKGREDFLLSIICNYHTMYRADQHVKQVVYTAAVMPTADFQSNLKVQLEALLNSKIDLTVNEKKELLGGFVLLVDGKLVDTSISAQLKQMKKRLLS